MGIELYWDNDERTVMLCEITGSWTWDEMYQTLEKIKKVTDAADYEIGAILDVSQGISVPGGTIFTPTALEHAKRMLKMGEGGTGPVVIVGANPMIRTIYQTFHNLDRKALGNVRFAATVDEARAMLAQRQPARIGA